MLDRIKCLYCKAKEQKSTGWKFSGGEYICMTCGATMIIEDDPKNWGIINENLALGPNGTRILIKEDEFKTGLECKTCEGKGHTEEICKVCAGTKFESAENADGVIEHFMCRACSVGQRGARKCYGFKLCPSCNGRTATIIIPEEAERRPTSGIIIAIGSKVTEFDVDDHVLYSNYVGQAFPFEGFALRVMHENDVYCKIKALKKEGLQKTIQETVDKDLENAGLAPS